MTFSLFCFKFRQFLGGPMRTIPIMILTLLLTTVFLSGCNKDEDQVLREQTSKASEGERLEEYATALKMEADLQRRYRFYKALQGTYAGVLQTEKGQSKVQVDLYFSHPPYPSDSNRTRLIEEVMHDLTSLSLKAFVNQWESAGEASISVGCSVENIIPDMNTGEINIVSEGCDNAYPLFLSDPLMVTTEHLALPAPFTMAQEKAQAAEIAQGVLSGRLTTVLQLRGQVKSRNIPQVYELLVTRGQ